MVDYADGCLRNDFEGVSYSRVLQRNIINRICLCMCMFRGERKGYF